MVSNNEVLSLFAVLSQKKSSPALTKTLSLDKIWPRILDSKTGIMRTADIRVTL